MPSKSRGYQSYIGEAGGCAVRKRANLANILVKFHNRGVPEAPEALALTSKGSSTSIRVIYKYPEEYKTLGWILEPLEITV